MFNHRFLQNVSAWSGWQSWINVSLCVVCLCFRGHFDILHHTLRRTIRAGGSGLFKWLNSQVLSFQCNKGASDAATDEEADSRRRRNELYAQMMVRRVSLKRQNNFWWLCELIPTVSICEESQTGPLSIQWCQSSRAKCEAIKTFLFLKSSAN